MSALLTLGIVFLCGFVTAERIDNVSPTNDNIRSVTLVDPAPVWDEATGTWKVPGSDGSNIESKPEPSTSSIEDGLTVSVGGTTRIVFNGNIPEGFGIPLLPPPDGIVYYQPPKELPAGLIVLNAIDSTAVEIANAGGATNMVGWSITVNNQTLYLFPHTTLEEDENLGIAINITRGASVKLVGANGQTVDSVDFPGNRPGLVYHRVPDETGTWQWIMGKVIIGSH